MFDRLKSLPLTIVLTILIWMYAESQVNSVHGDVRLALPAISVWVSGPPGVLGRYDVLIEPNSVEVVLAGPPDRIDPVRGQRSGQESGVYAYLDITPDDRPTEYLTYRTLRFVKPEGVSILQAPKVAFRLVESSGATTSTRPALERPATQNK